ncbi:tRNA (N(6)-L-threonylcarbamoyladenosine(37)-C(2))-methylthiotransferase MtaB [Candidatus Peregrinibacteria bacterium]|nr:tRNA (N(6)-L-threonylcarbamoyladenosine(37)-C(2))-methylthiotransferase MtaB [Candidatus Peregrinibacteria bacterium]
MKMIMKTLGCKANRYESDKIQDTFGNKHYIADVNHYDESSADLILVNTCTVTHIADRKSRQALKQLKKQHPHARTIVFGCGANVRKKDYLNLKYVDFVVQKRKDLYKLIETLANDYTKCNTSPVNEHRTRSLVKIQDGCNNFCTYCIIPYARGREKSTPLKTIIKEIQEKTAQGYKEIVLTGINVGMWHDDNKDLAGLIQTILDETSLPRLRLSSIEPHHYPDRFYRLFQNNRFCPHIHISLQSGSDTILKTMNRNYNTKEFTSIINYLRQASSDIGITTDVIVGFPGETEALFHETVEYVQAMRFSKIHIFPYSKRAGTVAATMKNQVPHAIKKARCATLASVEKQLREKFYTTYLGTTHPVLIESINSKGMGSGYTPNYIKTTIKDNRGNLKPNTVVEVTLQSVHKRPLQAYGVL